MDKSVCASQLSKLGAVSNIERCEKSPNLSTILKLAYGLKVKPAELFSGFTAEVMRKMQL